MEPWHLEVWQAIGLSLAPGFWKGYHWSVKLFEGFWAGMPYIQSWPILVDHVLHYGVHLKQKGLAVSTIKGRLSALAFARNALAILKCSAC